MRIIRADDLRLDWVLPTNDSDIRACSVGRSLDEWFVEIGKAWTQDKTIYNAPAGLYLIHAHGKFTNQANRQDLEGVELLKHIRLTDWLGALQRWHAIVYSFEPLEDILRRRPGDLILTSPSVTFLRLPDALNIENAVSRAFSNQSKHVSLADLASSSEYRARIDDSFRPFVACDFKPPDSEHELSNWWGARQVISGLSRVERIADGEGVPAAAETALKKLRNKKALYLAGQQSRAEKIDAPRRELIRRNRKLLQEHFQNGKKPPKVVYVLETTLRLA
jgi:hypothetical protein